jgi:anti-sigma factor (TIGR02949 family)
VSIPGCEAARRLIPSFLDGELVGEDRAAFQAHVDSCTACRRALADEEQVVNAVRRAVGPAQAPQAPRELRARIEAILAEPARRWSRAWRGAAAAVLLALAAAVAYRSLSRPATPPALAAGSDLALLAADTHLRYTRGQLPLEVGSERPEVLSRWFSGRVPFNLTLPDYPVGPGERKPYHLMGGRLVAFRDDYAAYVAYRMDDRPISLLVTSAQLAFPAGGEIVPFGSLVFHQRSVNGLKVITWTDKGLTYALASDLSVDGSQSCTVCHGSPQERRRLESFSPAPQS